jgi:hypothetical protein
VRPWPPRQFLLPVCDAGIEPPRPAKITQPVYPKKPFSDRVQGTVLIEFVVDGTFRITEREH